MPLWLLPDEAQVAHLELSSSPPRIVSGLEILVPGGAVIRINDCASVELVVELFSSLKS